MRVVMLEAPREVEAMLQPGPDGALESEVLGITLRTVDGKLEITWDGGSATV